VRRMCQRRACGVEISCQATAVRRRLRRHRNRRVHTGQTPAGDRVLDGDNCAYNALLRSLRCLGKRGFALLTGRWRALRHITASPRKIGTIVKAALVLTHFEHGRLT
jgi:hypothetical protein